MPVFKGKQVTLLGKHVSVGMTAEDFKVIDANLEEVRLADFGKQRKIISVIPSIDTGVCEAQTRRFNQEAAALENTVVITISLDLPFAQKRWCGANGLDNVVILSDHRYKDFGTKFGVLIEEFQLLNRSIFVLDENNNVLHVEYVEENSTHPNYEAVFTLLK